MMALVYHVSAQNGSANNSGSSESMIVSGTGAITDGTATVQLPVGTNLSGVNQGAGHDTIRIAARGDGIHGTDIFEITDVDDPNDRLTVTPAPGVGSDQAWTIGGAFATPQKAADCVDPGDTIWIKGDGDYLPNGAPIITLKTKGTIAQPIVVEGYRQTKGGATAFFQANAHIWPSDARFDDYRVRLDCDGTSYAGISKGSLSWQLYYVFRNVQVQNRANGQAIDISAAMFVNCAGRNNFVDLYASDPCLALNCLFDGFMIQGAYGPVDALGCEFINGAGTPYTGAGLLQFCRLLNNDNHAVNTSSMSNPPVIHCTIVGSETAKASGKAGLFFSAQSALAANNIIHNYAIGVKAYEAAGPIVVLRNNLITSCTVSYENVAPGVGDVIADDPGFVDAANGDYRLRSISPAIGRAWPSGDIGAEQRPGNNHGLLRMGAG